jgi:hypothetical protein
MKKNLHWYLIYTALAVVVGVVAYFCKSYWYIPVTLFAIIFHLINWKKLKWETIHIFDDEGYPGVAERPVQESKHLYRVLWLNIVVIFSGVIAGCIYFLVD